MATAKEFGLGDGITTGSADPACRVATFCSFASSNSVDATRDMCPLIEYYGYYVHLALLRTAPPKAKSMDRCVKKLTLRELTISELGQEWQDELGNCPNYGRDRTYHPIPCREHLL
jgi:hypothetical protein